MPEQTDHIIKAEDVEALMSGVAPGDKHMLYEQEAFERLCTVEAKNQLYEILKSDIKRGDYSFTPYDPIPGTRPVPSDAQVQDSVQRLIEAIWPEEVEPLLWEGDQA